MSSSRLWIKNSTVNSSELRKFWNCAMTACCSSCDFSARLMLDAIRSTRKEPSLSITTPSRTSLMGTKSCVACAFTFCLLAVGIQFKISNHKHQISNPERSALVTPNCERSLILSDQDRSLSLLSESLGTGNELLASSFELLAASPLSLETWSLCIHR